MMVNQQNRIENRAVASRMQTRTAWSERECTHLIDQIEKYGCAWSQIKENDSLGLGIFKFRDQVGLRDKARNLRVDFEL